jgi:hypothetical protein
MKEVLIVKSAGAVIHGRSLSLPKGKVYSVPDDVAEMLIAGGVAIPSKNAPAVPLFAVGPDAKHSADMATETMAEPNASLEDAAAPNRNKTKGKGR